MVIAGTFQHRAWVKKNCHDSRNVTSIYPCLSMVIAGTFSAPSLGSKNVMIHGMLLQFILVLVWSLLALFQHRAWVEKHDSWNTTLILAFVF